MNLQEAVMDLPDPVIHRMCEEAGAERVDGDCHDRIRTLLYRLLGKIMDKIKDMVRSNEKKKEGKIKQMKVTPEHVMTAMKSLFGIEIINLKKSKKKSPSAAVSNFSFSTAAETTSAATASAVIESKTTQTDDV
jgi:hypothetical protein